MFQDDPLWSLDYDAYEPEREKHREALCTVGNGYLGCRGALEEAVSDARHYPGTYIAGLYNRLVSKVAGRDIENEDLANVPDWTGITFKIGDGEWFNIDDFEVLDFRRQVDLYNGVLHRATRVRHPDGKVTAITSSRFAGMAERHLVAIRYSITPENYSVPVTIRSGLNGAIENEGVERYNSLNQHHLRRDREVESDGVLVLGVRTTQSDIVVVEQAAHRLTCDSTPVDAAPGVTTADRCIRAAYTVDAVEGKAVTIEKTVAIVTSRDTEGADPYGVAAEALAEAGSWDTRLRAHTDRWHAIWERLDVRIDGDPDTQRINRLHAYHLLSTASPHNADIDAGLPARGLHGEAYRGHIFWDEVFAFPIYNLQFPEIARGLLRYRFHRLDKAREYAREHGYRGAMFPWQSGSDGREETQVVHLNPVSGEWGPDFSSLQRHVSLAIAYNTWQYCHLTGDDEFLVRYGAELLFSIADFWSSKCTSNESSGHYEIRNVMGPNEFHETGPDCDDGGLNDNAYTNIMTVWVLDRALETVDRLGPDDGDPLLERLGIDADRLDLWRDITRRMHVHVRGDIIDQHNGFMELKELDWDHYRRTYDDIGRLDRILKAEGKQPDEYQVSKQGDLMMLFYVLPLDTITRILADVGISLSGDMLRKNYDYYVKRTSHGSTLSLGVHAHVAALLGDLDTSLAWYRQALHADLGDIQGGTTKEGIHVALMSSTLTLLMFAYAGLDVSGDWVAFAPRMPSQWERVAFGFSFRGARYEVELRKGSLRLTLKSASGGSVDAIVEGERITLHPGQETVATLSNA